MGLQWWTKTAPTTTSISSMDSRATSTTSSLSVPNCCCITKLVKKLKKHCRIMLRCPTSSHHQRHKSSKFQCSYDPMSHALNFDTSGCGGLLDNDDDHHFYAFSPKFVATPAAPSPILLATTSHKTLYPCCSF
ncbi:hypothetical protein RJ641_001533 [Dillenia turbinata]|uniref:Uncharacterized protein n=1 Tax=Dillenia turbinata TaxID=194707 RepID=A0AAN8VHQ0_9MAGN